MKNWNKIKNFGWISEDNILVTKIGPKTNSVQLLDTNLNTVLVQFVTNLDPNKVLQKIELLEVIKEMKQAHELN
jgi:hypothetical protein